MVVTASYSEYYPISSHNLLGLTTRAKEGKMICTEEQGNVLEELFVEVLLWLVNQLSVNPIAV